MDEALPERVDALERAITDGDSDLTELTAEAEALDRLAELEATVDELETRVAELEAATQALRGYVGNVRSVNQAVEQRADAALSKAEAVESAIQQEAGAARTGAGTTSVAATPADRQPSADGEMPDRSTGEAPATDCRETSATAERSDTSPRTARCESCGRTHPDGETGGSPRSADRTAASAHGGAGETLVPEDDPDPGTLRQLRNLL